MQFQLGKVTNYTTKTIEVQDEGAVKMRSIQINNEANRKYRNVQYVRLK